MGISLASKRDWENMQFNSLQDLNITIARRFNTVFLFNTVIYVFLFLCLYILIVCLCIFIVPADTLRLP